MTVSTAFALHGIETPSNFYGSLDDTTPNNLVEQLIQFSSGHPQPLFVANQAVRPELTFQTHDAWNILNETGLLGVDLSGGNLDLYYVALDSLGDRVASATLSHLRMRAATSFLYPRSIRAGHRSVATVDCRCCLLWDGTNEPLVPAGSVALSGTPAINEMFTLGKCIINTVELEGVQDLTVDLQPRLIELGDAGDIFDSFCAVESITPVITIRTTKTDVWDTYGLDGTALTAGDFYLRKKDADGNNVAAATVEHVKIAATNGLITCRNIAQDGPNRPAMAEIQILCRAASSAANALAFSQSAIP